MGLNNREAGMYFTILGGKLCQRVPQGTEGAVERINKEKKVVHELFYDSFTGKLEDIRAKDGEYGKTWVFVFSDENQTYNLQLSYSNSYATNILKMLPNVDLTKPFKISPSQKIVDGKTQSSLFINQDGKPIKHAFTKDNPNGLPPMEQKVVKGQQVWDDTERLVFLQHMVDTQILPLLNHNKAGKVGFNGTAAAMPAQNAPAAFEAMTADAPTEEDEF